ncbi:hypothetical protein BD410DRAFT_796446 [Rickenella mellea]|uniref:Uncharacterized protein n=1 Tax=Rickenella mellea TaxID=50990 RepID=A0A4Y7PJJ8_9AGAM|nr:hypothetical protein BD410DRAFT_796446 [Rickenella mellea]
MHSERDFNPRDWRAEPDTNRLDGFGRQSVISDEPSMTPGMSLTGGFSSSTVTSFPNIRGPNLNKLTKVYYRLLTISSGPYSSMYPIHADDPSLAFLYAEHVPPPGLADNYITFICTREQVHKSRVRMFISVRAIGAGMHEAEYEAVEPTDKISLLEGGRGLTEEDPLRISINLPPGGDKQEAFRPLPLWVEGRRVAAVAGSHGCSMFWTCLSATARYMVVCPTTCPKSFCGCFRTCWIETWSFGNPAVYESRPDNKLFCCCCWACDCNSGEERRRTLRR